MVGVKMMKVMMVVAMVLVAGAAAAPSRARRQSSFLTGIINALLTTSENSHSDMQDTGDLGRQAGYAVEKHEVVTTDGYKLTVHHIPPFGNPQRRSLRLRRAVGNERQSKSNSTTAAPTGSEDLSGTDEIPPANVTNSEKKKVVFLQHGLMGSSDNWNTNNPKDSLAYLLSDDGYDVWMGNFRGNIYSRRHINMSHLDPVFWKFSFDEMASYDLPAMLDYVLEQTDVESLHYVGHSMGTTVFFAYMSSQPEEVQRRVASMVALAPVATVTTITSPIKYLAPIVSELQFMLRLFGNDQELMTNRLLISLWDPYRVCSSQSLCENLQFMITGFDPSRADKTMLPVILTHNPAGASTQTLFHFAQGYNSGKFQHFDWGTERNMERYGQSFPPEYNVSNIKIPVSMFWAPNDWLAGEKDVLQLEKHLPKVETSHRVGNKVFSHLDFLWATDARNLVYEKLFDILDGSVFRHQ